MCFLELLLCLCVACVHPLRMRRKSSVVLCCLEETSRGLVFWREFTNICFSWECQPQHSSNRSPRAEKLSCVCYRHQTCVFVCLPHTPGLDRDSTLSHRIVFVTPLSTFQTVYSIYALYRVTLRFNLVSNEPIVCISMYFWFVLGSSLCFLNTVHSYGFSKI